MHQTNRTIFAAKARQAADFINTNYNVDNEKEDILQTWNLIVKQM